MKNRLHMILLMMLAGWINRHQQEMIEYLKEENKILREKLGRKRLLLNDDQCIVDDCRQGQGRGGGVREISEYCKII